MGSHERIFTSRSSEFPHKVYTYTEYTNPEFWPPLPGIKDFPESEKRALRARRYQLYLEKTAYVRQEMEKDLAERQKDVATKWKAELKGNRLQVVGILSQLLQSKKA